MIISLIVAASENNVIGKDNTLPWHLPNDLRHFRDLTRGHPIVMGRKTFQSIGKPLPDRLNIIISRTLSSGDGYMVFANLEFAFIHLIKNEKLSDQGEVFVIGGSEIYQSALINQDLQSGTGHPLIGHPVIDRIYLTRVHANVEGDAFFPEIDSKQWQEVSCEDHPADAENQYPYSFITYHRIR